MEIKLECARCGEKFIVNTVTYKALGINQIPNACPQCCDRKSKKKS
jgi:hypothetical protein